jgi:hypothetical protein
MFFCTKGKVARGAALRQAQDKPFQAASRLESLPHLSLLP